MYVCSQQTSKFVANLFYDEHLLELKSFPKNTFLPFQICVWYKGRIKIVSRPIPFLGFTKKNKIHSEEKSLSIKLFLLFPKKNDRLFLGHPVKHSFKSNPLYICVKGTFPGFINEKSISLTNLSM